MSLLAFTGAALATTGLLAGGCAYAARWPASQIFGTTFIAGADTAGAHHTVALTYDDGPSERNTAGLLDLLASQNVHATFFLIGNHVRKQPELARRIVREGHAVGNHTTMHPDLARKNEARIRAELTECQAIVADITGVTPHLFRPPYGSRRPAVLRVARELGLTPVLWNVTAKDWAGLGAGKVLANVERGVQRNRRSGVQSNILFHDASHLDGTEASDRTDTLTVTSALLGRSELRFVTVDAMAGFADTYRR